MSHGFCGIFDKVVDLFFPSGFPSKEFVTQVRSFYNLSDFISLVLFWTKLEVVEADISQELVVVVVVVVVVSKLHDVVSFVAYYA